MSINLGSAALDVQTAIINTLRANLALLPQVTGVFDYVTENTPFPYVVFGEVTESDNFNTMQGFGREVYYTVHVWSRKPGFAEVHRIASAVIAAIEDTELLGLGSWKWALTRYIQLHTIHDPDGVSQHGIIRFRTCVSQAS